MIIPRADRAYFVLSMSVRVRSVFPYEIVSYRQRGLGPRKLHLCELSLACVAVCLSSSAFATTGAVLVRYKLLCTFQQFMQATLCLQYGNTAEQGR